MEKSTRSAIRSISVLHTPYHNIVIYKYVDCAACISNECGKNAKVETHIFVQIHAHTYTHQKPAQTNRNERNKNCERINANK